MSQKSLFSLIQASWTASRRRTTCHVPPIHVLITICVISVQFYSLLWTLALSHRGSLAPSILISESTWVLGRPLAPDSLCLRRTDILPQSSIVIVESLWEGSAVQGPRYTVGPIRLCYRLFLAKPPSTCDAGCVRMHNRCVLLSQIMATEWFTGMICNNQKRNIISAMVIKHLSDVDEVRIGLV